MFWHRKEAAARFRRDISEKHEKSSTAQLLSFVLLVALIAVVVRLGAPGLEPQQPHDPASVAAMPYTLVGEGDTWRLTVRVEPADEETAAPYRAAAMELADGPDVIGYEEALAAVPAYKATLTLEYLGEDAAAIKSAALDFAPHTDYRLEVRRSRGDASDFDALIAGTQPIMTVYYPENVELAGRIPPVDGTYTARIAAGGAGTDTLTLKKEAAA